MKCWPRRTPRRRCSFPSSVATSAWFHRRESARRHQRHRTRASAQGARQPCRHGGGLGRPRLGGNAARRGHAFPRQAVRSSDAVGGSGRGVRTDAPGLMRIGGGDSAMHQIGSNETAAAYQDIVTAAGTSSLAEARFPLARAVGGRLRHLHARSGWLHYELECGRRADQGLRRRGGARQAFLDVPYRRGSRRRRAGTDLDEGRARGSLQRRSLARASRRQPFPRAGRTRRHPR